MDKTINQNLIVNGSITADSVKTQKINEPIGKIIMGTGASQPHNNMPPYLTVYMWRRIA